MTDCNDVSKARDEPGELVAIGLNDRYITRKEVARMASISQTTLFRFVRDGRLPRPVELGPRCLRWIESEVIEALRAKPRR